MKLLHVETGKHLYGGAQQVMYLLDGLRARGHESILACTEESAIADKASREGFRVEAMACTGEIDLEFMLRLRHLMRVEKPDLAHLHSRRGADSLGLLAAKWTSTPVVISRRVDNPETPWIAKFKYGLCDHVITISEAIKRVLLSIGIDGSKITCVRSAVFPERFVPTVSKSEFLEDMELAPDSFVIAVVAQFIERKNHIGLLRALAAIKDQLPANVQVLFFGQGPLLESLQNAVMNLNLENRVKFVGFRDDLHEFISHVDLLVHPAKMEGLGVSLIEAAAAGVPIIGNPAGGIPEIVRNRKNGLLVDCSDPEALGEAIFNLCSDDRARARMGELGRQLVADEFSVDAMVEGNLAVYRNLLNNS